MTLGFRWAIVAACSVAALGCGAQAPAVQKPVPAQPARVPGEGLMSEDPCANRLHEICGALLMYYFDKRHLPDSLDELRAQPTYGLPSDLTCPDSHQPYVYDRTGLYDMIHHSRVIVYDATPVHGGNRWAIQLDESQGANGSLVAKVVLIPDHYFLTRAAK